MSKFEADDSQIGSFLEELSAVTAYTYELLNQSPWVAVRASFNWHDGWQ